MEIALNEGWWTLLGIGFLFLVIAQFGWQGGGRWNATIGGIGGLGAVGCLVGSFFASGFLAGVLMFLALGAAAALAAIPAGFLLSMFGLSAAKRRHLSDLEAGRSETDAFLTRRQEPGFSIFDEVARQDALDQERIGQIIRRREIKQVLSAHGAEATALLEMHAALVREGTGREIAWTILADPQMLSDYFEMKKGGRVAREIAAKFVGRFSGHRDA